MSCPERLGYHSPAVRPGASGPGRLEDWADEELLVLLRFLRWLLVRPCVSFPARETIYCQIARASPECPQICEQRVAILPGTVRAPITCVEFAADSAGDSPARSDHPAALPRPSVSVPNFEDRPASRARGRSYVLSDQRGPRSACSCVIMLEHVRTLSCPQPILYQAYQGIGDMSPLVALLKQRAVPDEPLERMMLKGFRGVTSGLCPSGRPDDFLRLLGSRVPWFIRLPSLPRYISALESRVLPSRRSSAKPPRTWNFLKPYLSLGPLLLSELDLQTFFQRRSDGQLLRASLGGIWAG